MFSGHLDLIQLLVEHGADPFLCTTHKSSFSMTYSRSGVNAFNMAAMHGRRDVIQALLRVVAAQQQGSSVCKGRSIERRPQNETIVAPEVCKEVSCHVFTQNDDHVCYFTAFSSHLRGNLRRRCDETATTTTPTHSQSQHVIANKQQVRTTFGHETTSRSREC